MKLHGTSPWYLFKYLHGTSPWYLFGYLSPTELGGIQHLPKTEELKLLKFQPFGPESVKLRASATDLSDTKSSQFHTCLSVEPLFTVC